MLFKIPILFIYICNDKKVINVNKLTDDDGNGAKYSGVIYLSPTAEIIALLLDVVKALIRDSSRLIEFLRCEFTLISEIPPFSR